MKPASCLPIAASIDRPPNQGEILGPDAAVPRESAIEVVLLNRRALGA
jgi:hypothetical protein